MGAMVQFPLRANKPAQEVGSINLYTCEACRKVTVAIHRDAGVTPFMIGCRRTAGCQGNAVSSFYPPQLPATLVPHLVFFRCVDEDDLVVTLRKYPRRFRREMRDHHEQGGCFEHDVPPRFAVMHLKCQGVAFLYDRIPAGDLAVMYEPTGARIEMGDQPACWTCDETVTVGSDELVIDAGAVA